VGEGKEGGEGVVFAGGGESWDIEGVDEGYRWVGFGGVVLSGQGILPFTVELKQPERPWKDAKRICT
jgi:hypothetical protein